ncbi:ATP-binding cassette domain-containing protein [Epibacterium sp. SM1969]|uniref:ATP-binding cassette domain-containing protein n=2 Tax=Tritonibacter aquimaris TaxID=2663379 RepID=A0A844AUB7_9RHOB|nr:ATP-binding cassette domain-containing protein [Tritonibacter aquimaris]
MLDQDLHTTPITPSLQHNDAPLMRVRDLSLYYGQKQALDGVTFDLYPQEILAFIGPSGCGKTTALKCLNRMHDGNRGVRIEGSIEMEGVDIHDPDIDPPLLRRRFGWVAQKPNPFPFSIWRNVAYGARIHGLMNSSADLDAHVENCLRRAFLWDEVKDHLHTKQGTSLSGGQQQRLCVARALATQPDVLLMDEPTGSVDPVATAKLEALMLELKSSHSIVVVTHSMMEAKRIADRVAYFHLGQLLEIGSTQMIFDHPADPRTRAFVGGKFG